MKKVFSVLLALLVTAPVLAQSWGPLTLPQPTAADDLKYVQWNATTRRYQLSTVAVSADNVIGNEVTNTTDTTLTRSGSGTAGSPYTLGLNLANANTWTAVQTASFPNITTTLTEGLALVNTTPSTSGVTVQQSPALRFEGHGWETTGGTDDKFEWYNFVLPATGSTTTSTMYWQHSKDGAAVTSPMTLRNDGTLTVLDAVNIGTIAQFSSNVNLRSAGEFRWSSSTAYSGTKDVGLARDSAGVLRVTNGSTGTGVVKATSYTAGTSAGITSVITVRDSGGAADCTITVTGGIITATTCSHT